MACTGRNTKYSDFFSEHAPPTPPLLSLTERGGRKPAVKHQERHDSYIATICQRASVKVSQAEVEELLRSSTEVKRKMTE